MAKIQTPDEFTYEGWAHLLGAGDERRLGHNTYLRRTYDGVVIVLHNTPVVHYERTGRIAVTFGGWGTVTTRDRINQALPAHLGVSQKAGEQILVDRSTDPWTTRPLDLWNQNVVQSASDTADTLPAA